MKYIDQINELELKEIRLIISDFDGVFTNNRVYTSETGEEFLQCNKYDSTGISQLVKIPVSLIVVSSELNKSVSARCKKLSIDCYQGVTNKGKFVCRYMNDNIYSKEKVLYIGNDVNDLSVLGYVGVTVATADAHFDYASKCRFSTRRAGGDGCIRELCDLIGGIHNG